MALINCPECGKDVSSEAKNCVHCGYPIQNPMVKKVPPEDVLMPVGSTKKKSIAIAVTAAIILVAICVVVINSIKQNKAQSRDLDLVFNISFSMTMEDVIEYEAETYGNTEYDYDAENNRLDFAPYQSSSGKMKWKHKYFFDETTDKLTSAYYMDITASSFDKGNSECDHIKPLKNALIEEIKEWDKTTEGGLFKYAYGTLGGVGCQVTYQDATSSGKALFISRTDK